MDSPFLKRYQSVIYSLSILLFSLLVARYLIATRPESEKSDPPRVLIPVETLWVERQPHLLNIEAFGRVEAKQRLPLQSSISGRVVSVSKNFEAGELTQEDELILSIEPIPYQENLARAKAQLKVQESAYQQELAKSRVAESDFHLLEGDQNLKTNGPKVDLGAEYRELILRLPQKKASQYQLKASQSAVDLALYQLKETQIKAPFKALVVGRNIEKGQVLTPGQVIGDIVQMDRLWVKAKFSPRDLPQLKVGSRAHITSYNHLNEQWQGTLIRILPWLEQEQMITAVIEVPQEDSQDAMGLMLGSFVQVQLETEGFKTAYRLPESAVKENKRLWLYKDGKLDIAPCQVLGRSKGFVFVEGPFTEGLEVVLSPLSQAEKGTLLSKIEGVS